MDLKSFWSEDGNANGNAPRWVRLRSSMVSSFPSYNSDPSDQFAQEVHDAVDELKRIMPKENGPAFVGGDPSVPDFSKVKLADLPDKPEPLEKVVSDVTNLFEGMMNLMHPMTMPNVLPPANRAGIIAHMLGDVFCPNLMTGEFAWNVAKAEMESAAMVARLFGWDPEAAGGIYTYGGVGCYQYGLKYAMTQVLGPESRYTGIRTDGKLLVSQQGHYAKNLCPDWHGLGMNNTVNIETNCDDNSMCMVDLEEKMKRFHEQGVPIMCIVCTIGTTDAFAVDRVDKVRELINKYPNKEPYGPPLLFCDAVVGWSFLTFRKYDFEKNPLNFSADVRRKLKENLEMIKLMEHADAVAIDLHKSWAPQNCAFFMMKDLANFKRLMGRRSSVYLQERVPYNPGLYSMEGTRSGSIALAGWASLKYFGYEGFQCMLGGILEVQNYLRDRLRQESNLVCVNEAANGFVTLIRVYPENVVAEQQYEKEVNDESYQKDLVKHNKLQEKVADTLWTWFRSGRRIEGKYAPYTGFTSGFRTTKYCEDPRDKSSVVFALKSFPININVTAQTMDDLIKVIKLARDHVLEAVPEAAKVEKLCLSLPEQTALSVRD